MSHSTTEFLYGIAAYGALIYAIRRPAMSRVSATLVFWAAFALAPHGLSELQATLLIYVGYPAVLFYAAIRDKQAE